MTPVSYLNCSLWRSLTPQLQPFTCSFPQHKSHIREGPTGCHLGLSQMSYVASSLLSDPWGLFLPDKAVEYLYSHEGALFCVPIMAFWSPADYTTSWWMHPPVTYWLFEGWLSIFSSKRCILFLQGHHNFSFLHCGVMLKTHAPPIECKAKADQALLNSLYDQEVALNFHSIHQND